jgi:hypothetical protein
VKNGGRVCRVEIQGKLCLSNFSTTTSPTDRPATFPNCDTSFLAFLHELPFLIEQLLRRLISSPHISLTVTESNEQVVKMHNSIQNMILFRETMLHMFYIETALSLLSPVEVRSCTRDKLHNNTGEESKFLAANFLGILNHIIS